MYYKISSIMFNGGQKASNASEIFIAQPDEHKESLAGRLFILLEIESQKSKALKIVNFLVNNINYNYYQNEKILLRERMTDLKVEHIFETALANVNKDLVEFLQQEKIKISPYAINMTVGVIYENYLYLSSLGKNKNLLIYPSQKENDQTFYKISDIEGSKEKSAQAVSFTKLFSDVVSGPLPESGYYFLANEALVEHLSEKQIIETITKLPPAGAATHIKNIIQQINVPVNFLGIIIKNTVNTNEGLEEEDEKKSSHLFNLDKTKEETEEILKPSGVINLKNLAQRSGQLFPSKNTSGEQPSKTKSKKWENIKKAGRKINILCRRISKKCLTLIAVTWKKIRSEKSKEEKTPAEIISKRIPNTTGKIILAGVFVFLTAFAVFTFFNSSEKNNEQTGQEINNLTEEIKNKQNQVDANLLYNNNDKARTLLEEIKASMLELRSKLRESSASEEEYSQYEEFLNKLEEQVREIRNVVSLESAEKIADLGEFSESPQSNNITLAGDHLYTADPDNSLIFQVNVKNARVDLLENPDLSSLGQNYLAQTGGNIYYLANDGVIELNPENNEIRKIAMEMPDNLDAGGVGGYSDNIYLLDKSSDQIYKYQKTYNDLPNRQEWITQEGQKLEDARDMAIDGYIYVLTSKGETKKYLSGELQEFSLDKINPDWGETARIRVSGDMETGNIYILDSKQSRIAVFDKQEGGFLRQYQDKEKFSNIKDFYVDEVNNILYFLNDNSLYFTGLE